MCCFSQLSLISEQLAHLIRIDPFNVLPREICLKILGYLDATSLCRAAQVTKKWKALADDNVLWKGICEQHIGQKCAKCGWGLPILEKKRCAYRPKSSSPGPPSLPAAAPSLYAPGSPGPSSRHRAPTPSSALKMTATLPTCSKRSADPCSIALTPPLKRYRSDETNSNSTSPDSSPSPVRSHSPPRSGTVARTSDDDDAVFSESSVSSTTIPIPPSVRKPWKVVFGERMTVERNWRRGRCTTRTLTGHTDGVMCLQFSENLPHPSFPVLISGSYDRTVRVWNMETGTQLHCLRGHTFAVRALQFDEAKLITGSMDCTLKVWDWRAGKCIRTLTGHSEGVVCLHYDENVLASGSVDSTIKVWNLRTGGSFTLRGHSDWVNSVQLWDPNPSTTNERASSEGPPLFESSGSRSPSHNCCYQIDPGKMLFSASDDGTIRLWDLNARTCVRQFVGHMGQVQSMKLLLAGEHDGDDSDEEEEREREKTPSSPPDAPHHTYPFPYTYLPQYHQMQQQHLQQEPQRQLAAKNLLVPKRKKPVLVSGSLDNTIKLWDIETGQAIRTYFGHIEGVWAVASDKMRLVSGSHDRTIKVSCSFVFFTLVCAHQNKICAGLVKGFRKMPCDAY